MKRVRVWVSCGHSQCGSKETRVIEFADDDSDDMIEADCSDMINQMIGDNFDTGWAEMEEGEEV